MKSIVNWFVDNPIAANLLMIVIWLSGFVYYYSLGKEVFPRDELDSLTISATYPGASPREVEQQVVVRLEEAVADLSGIDEMNSTSTEGNGSIYIEVAKGYDTQRLLNEIKSRVDTLTSLPDDVDEINVEESLFQRPLMSIAVYGNVDESLLKETAQWLQQELISLDAVATVDIEEVRDREMSITISAETLRNYNLRFSDIAQAIRSDSINLPAGTIKSFSGNLQLQTRGQAYSQEAFEDIVLVANDSGAQLRLGDIAEVSDGFAEVDSRGTFNGQPVAYLELYTTDPPNIVTAAAGARKALDDLASQLPTGVSAAVSFDWSSIYQSRMNLMLKNTLSGLLLVFAVLMLFLRPSLAIWVCAGIATAFLGVFWFLPSTGVTLNMLSMYGFLLALGIVVDDAIVVGESIYSHQQKGLSGPYSAKLGAEMVLKPVVFAVVSTMIFFGAMFGLDDDARVMSVPIAVVVILCLFFSLVECLLILPSHLAGAKPEKVNENPGPFTRLRLRLSGGMESLAQNQYHRFLALSLKHSGTTVMIFLMIFAVVMTLFIVSGYLKKSFAPVVPSSRVSITALLPEGVNFEETKRVQAQIEQAANKLESDEQLLEINGSDPFIKTIRSSAYNNRVRVRVGLVDADLRDINIVQVKDRWRQLIGPLTGVKEFSLRFTINRSRKDLRFLVSLPGNNQALLGEVVEDVRKALTEYSAIEDIEDTLEGARTEIELQLKPNARLLGLTLEEVARQMRQGVYGEEVQKIPRGSDDVKVVLRYPAEQRQSLEAIKQLIVRTADGRSIPLTEVVNILEVPGYTKIYRENRRRTIAISANVIDGVDSLALTQEFLDKNLSRLQQQYRGLAIEVTGAVAEEKDFNHQILVNFGLAFLVSFGLMAIIFRSYWQPLLILSAIPFGFVGAVIGHLLLGEAVTMNSMLGFIACAGVVVNDNLVLLDRIHRLRDEGLSVSKSILQGGVDRFRAIILTSLTTFIGLMPILSETSIQAQFLIPMVVSLAFGVLFATAVTLIFVPNLYFLGEKSKLIFRRKMPRALRL